MTTVLVVDNDPSVLKGAAKILRRVAYTALEAGSGDEALAVIGKAGGRIDLLLTDVVMPRMNGGELARAVLARYPGVRVLFMSASTEDELTREGVRVAEVNLINKPFTVDGLRRKVADHIGERHPRGN